MLRRSSTQSSAHGSSSTTARWRTVRPRWLRRLSSAEMIWRSLGPPPPLLLGQPVDMDGLLLSPPPPPPSAPPVPPPPPPASLPALRRKVRALAMALDAKSACRSTWLMQSRGGRELSRLAGGRSLSPRSSRVGRKGARRASRRGWCAAGGRGGSRSRARTRPGRGRARGGENVRRERVATASSRWARAGSVVFVVVVGAAELRARAQESAVNEGEHSR